MRRRGFSLIGILISLACIVVLMSIYMTSMHKAVTGGTGKSTQGSIWGMQDQIQLQMIVKAMTIDAMTGREDFLIPSVLSRSNDVYDNTSANFWSALVMQNLVAREQLVSPNDNGWIEPAGYDYVSGGFWDTSFSTDLSQTFNVSYAHMPLWGERLRRRWNPQAGRFPILGNRGPEDGIERTNSLTLDMDGIWRGWVCYADGSIEWQEGTTAVSRWDRSDGVQQDNIFLIEEDDSSDDAILGITQEVDDYGPILIWD